jgi:hypothetical protein
LTGALGYFLYTYASMAFLTAFNNLFLVYVALFSLSLFAFILALSAGSRIRHPPHWREFPAHRHCCPDVCAGALPAGRLVGTYLERNAGHRRRQWAESYTTLVIQALDLG